MSWKFRQQELKANLAALFSCLVLLSVLTSTYGLDVEPSRKPLLANSKKPPTTFAVPTTIMFTPNPTPLLPRRPPSSIEVASSTTTTPIADICINGITALSVTPDEQLIEHHERQFVQTIEGDAMLSVMTNDPISALFLVDRLNEANLIEADFEIGVRVISVESEEQAENLLIQEVAYQQQCITHAIGIFLDHDLYLSLQEIIKELEYNIWPIPSPRRELFPKVAHLLHQMPWGDKGASVEISADQLTVYNEFMEAARKERMCLMHFKSADNIYILFGNKLANHQLGWENGTIFAVPTERAERGFIADLPENSYIMMENEVDLRAIDENATQATLHDVLVGKTVLPSRVLVFARPLLDLLRWIRGSLMKNCKRESGVFVLDTCFNFLTFVGDWPAEEQQSESLAAADLLDVLHMRALSTTMNFLMYQKQRVASDNSGEHHLELREIASQSFITNVTTFYHYNRDNHTSLQMKAKFGQVFNCQYVAGENQRYPFLFEGESVMFWRLKSEAWVATGLTAAILGVIITIAILVFILLRISLGDVFEGNPVTSILLLGSLILLFTAFAPFAMEYVGEHRNSHITFDDAATLNTLCAVRVFIVTLVYCFTFSLLLCRAVLLASIGSEGGFLSHVNGYIQAVICFFSVLVQLGMSTQLLVVMHIASESVSCENMYYGPWLWGLMAYNMLLLLCVVGLVPFIYRSQRNYREGILIVIGGVLIFIIWVVWITMSFFGDQWRDAAIPLGMQATGWAVLFGILIPRTFLIVRGIERSDIAQALPSLTSLAFAQNNQFSSEQSVYECVNPAMRHCSQDEIRPSPSEIPTLPLRGGGPRRQQFFANLRQANANINPQRPPPRPQRDSPGHSSQSSLPDSPDNSKITRF